MQAPPRFSSFRPKSQRAPPAPAPEPVAPHPPQPKRDDHDKHRSQRQTEHRDEGERAHRHRRHRHHSRDKSHARSKHHSREASPVPAVTTETDVFIENDTDDLFVIDRRGDLGNVKYGYNEKYKVPNYIIPSLRKLIGDTGRDGGDDIPRRSPLSSLSRQERERLKLDPVLVLRGVEEETAPDLDEDFIRLNPGKKRKRTSPKGALRLLGTSRQDDASDDADPGSEESSTSADDNAQEELEPAQDNLATLKAEKVRLSQLVKSEPDNVVAWLEYIDFQDDWIRQISTLEEFTMPKEEQRSIAEVKLSVYQKALASVSPKNTERETLLVGMMEQAELVLESPKLATKWKQVVEDNPEYLDLRQNYLDYMQSDPGQFDYTACRDQYATYLDLLQQGGHANQSRMLYVLMRMTAFMSEAGFTEHAVAIWQATLELNCFKNTASGPEKAWEDTVHDFESFWDEERPRIGENGGHGWCDPRSSGVAPTHVKAQASLSESDATSQLWLGRERARTAQAFFPGRIADENDDGDDPYHVVLFADIKPFLHPVSYSGFPTDLINAFLCFMHLPPLSGTQKTGYWLDQYLRNDSFEHAKTALATGAATATESSALPRFALPYYRLTPELLFQDGGNLARAVTRSLTHDEVDFVSHTLKALDSRFSDWTNLVEYSLALELRTSPATVRKTAKALLKASPSNLRLYNAYALIELRLGKLDVANNVLRTAINMSSSLDASARADLPNLCHTIVWSALRTDNHSLALECILSKTPSGTLASVPSSSIEAAEAYLNSSRTAAMAANPIQSHNAALASTLLTLLYYITSSRDLATAIASFAAQTAILASNGLTAAPAIELLHQSQAALIDYHISHNLPYRPAAVRTALQESMTMVPGNTLVLELYAKTEARFRLDDRVREIAKEVLGGGGPLNAKRTTRSVSGRLRRNDVDKSLPTYEDARLIITTWAIHNELSRAAKASEGAMNYAVRAAFERAVADRQSKHSVYIWTKWIDWEISLVPTVPEKGPRVQGQDVASRRQEQKKMERLKKSRLVALKRVRDIWYRGLNCLPWVKEWCLKGVEVLMEMGEDGEKEAKGVIEMMVDRGIRVFEEA